MIKFFRKIRQRLLTENKFSKYLIYAIGEIILVMIGILLALQVNNWNINRIEEKTERKFLIGIKNDLMVDSKNLQEFIEDKVIKEKSAATLLNYNSPKNPIEIRLLDSTIWQVFRWREFHPSTNSIDEIIGSGSLGIIKNDTLKKRLLNIKHKYSLIEGGTEHMRSEYESYLYNQSAKFRELMPYLNVETYINSDTIKHYGSIDSGNFELYKSQMDNLLNDQIFRNGLKLSVLNNHSMRLNCQKILKEIRALIEQLDAEVTK
ncbi:MULTISPECIES: DUF6090 family protein [Altibacter]|uniref:DUF6090 family protein n=1 Tax=Altibacter TaxID=1535231 RepID=UPI00068F4F5E|nr:MULTISPECIES: DUF6090 family protein [Altibacter]MCW9037721.1 DUF6090 family protein [Altibacter sp.]